MPLLNLCKPNSVIAKKPDEAYKLFKYCLTNCLNIAKLLAKLNDVSLFNTFSHCVQSDKQTLDIQCNTVKYNQHIKYITTFNSHM